MNINGEPVYVGRDFGGRELVIDEAVAARYQAALDHPLPLYAEVAPGLVLHSECYEDLSWYLANFWGNLHARQEWELFAEIPLGTPVRTRGFIRERYRKRGRDYVVKETWVQDAATGRLLNRGITHQSFVAENAAAGAVAVDKDREKRADRRFEIGGRGKALEPLERTVTEDVCMAFSGPTENYHTNRKAAHAFGFPDIVVQGMLPICVASELLTRQFGRGFLAGGKMDVRLVNVLWADETVRACAEEVDEVPEADRTRVHLDVWVEKTDGTRVIVGTASASVAPQGPRHSRPGAGTGMSTADTSRRNRTVRRSSGAIQDPARARACPRRTRAGGTGRSAADTPDPAPGRLPPTLPPPHAQLDATKRPRSGRIVLGSNGRARPRACLRRDVGFLPWARRGHARGRARLLK